MNLLGVGISERERYELVRNSLYGLGDQIGYWRDGMFTHPEDFEKYIDRALNVAPQELKGLVGNVKSTAMKIYNFKKGGEEDREKMLERRNALLVLFAAQMMQVEKKLETKVDLCGGWDGVYLKTQRSLSTNSPLFQIEFEPFKDYIKKIEVME
jgi:predicted Zn-dependent protease with MMP-like domain